MWSQTIEPSELEPCPLLLTGEQGNEKTGVDNSLLSMSALCVRRCMLQVSDVYTWCFISVDVLSVTKLSGINAVRTWARVYKRTRRTYYCGTECKEAISHSHFPLPSYISLKIL